MIPFPTSDKELTASQIFLLEPVFSYLRGSKQFSKTEVIQIIMNSDPPLRIILFNYCVRIMKLILELDVVYTIIHIQERVLQLIGEFLSTCQILFVTVFEVYLLPLLYNLALNQLKNEKQALDQISRKKNISFNLSLKCIEIMMIWASVKPKRLFQNYQMNEDSLFIKLFRKFTEQSFGRSNKSVLFNSNEQLCNKYGLDIQNTEKQIEILRKKFLFNLSVINEDDQNFKMMTIFYLNKFVYSTFDKLTSQLISVLKSQKKRRFEIEELLHSVSKQSHFKIQQISEIDYSLLYRTLDPYFSSSLVRFIFANLQDSESFQEKTVCIHLLCDLVKWGDIEAYLAVTYSDTIEGIAKRMAEVKGEKSLHQGLNIYPEIPNKSGKEKFYIEFLRFLEIFGVCIEDDLEDQIQTQKIRGIYKQLKYYKKFKFPQNLMLRRIQNEFVLKMKQNIERNTFFLNMIVQNPSSVYNHQMSAFSNSKLIDSGVQLQLFKRIEEIQKVLDEIFFSNIPQRLKKNIEELFQFEEEYELELENAEQYSVDDLFIEGYFDKGEKIITTFSSIKPLCKRFLAAEININEFMIKIKESLNSVWITRSVTEQKKSRAPSSKLSFDEQKEYSGHLSNFSKYSKDKVFHSYKVIKSQQNLIDSNQSPYFFSQKEEKSVLSIKSIDKNEVIKMQSPKFKYLDHSASYSSLHTKKTIFQNKNKKNVSNRIQSILLNMKRLYTTQQNSHFKIIKPKNKSIELIQNEIKAPSLEPSLFSVETQKSIKDMNFRDCFQIQKQIIKSSKFAKVYLKQKVKKVENPSCFSAEQNQNMFLCKDSQTQGSQATSVKGKKDLAKES